MSYQSIDLFQAFREPPPPLDFILPGLLAGTVGALVAPGGAGKSMLALELGVLVATGVDMTGVGKGEVRETGKVIVLAAEDPKDALCHRIHALGKHEKMTNSLRAEVARNVEVESLAGMQIDVQKNVWATFLENCAVGKRILFLDTLRRFHKLDENDAGQMADLLGIFEAVTARTKCSIVFLHHVGKAAAMNGNGDAQQAGRGSSVLVDNVRWQMYLSGCSKGEAEPLGIDEESRRYFVRAGVSKQNYGPPVADGWLTRVEGGVLVPAQLSTSPVTSKKRRKNSNEA